MMFSSVDFPQIDAFEDVDEVAGGLAGKAFPQVADFDDGRTHERSEYPQRTSSNFSSRRTSTSSARPINPIITMPATTRS